ncbi:MAG: hypothetical protein HY681_04825 [Chloroflexi bacterium]|nr:hypothetical protein [Chloroflexota bacterium]
MDIVIVAPASKLLKEIEVLARSQSHRLGFLPEGAFEEKASLRRILAATDELGSLMGYVAYNVSHDRAKLIHVCVAAEFRRSHVALTLLNELEKHTRTLRGMYLDCRDDFGLGGVWPRLGFYARGDKLGRGNVPQKLTTWWRDYGLQTLFDYSRKHLIEDARADAVLDRNVFLDLIERRENSEEARALEADWLLGEVKLCITPEMLNEMRRDSDSERQRLQSEIVSQFEPLTIGVNPILS